jgi:hypothetical protein
MKLETRNFETLAEFLTACQQAPTTKQNSSAREASSWTAHTTFEQTQELAAHGWREGVEKMERTRALIKPPQGLESLTPTPIIADDGDEVLVDRFLDGESDHFLAFPQVITPRSGRVVPVFFNTSCSSAISAENIARKGAAALALVDAIEGSGARVELTIAGAFVGKSRRLNVQVIAKRAEDPLELDRMAFLMTHPCTFRRLFFRILETSEDPLHYGSSYGTPGDFTAAQLPDGAIYFGADKLYSDECAVKLAQNKLDEWTARAAA